MKGEANVHLEGRDPNMATFLNHSNVVERLSNDTQT